MSASPGDPQPVFDLIVRQAQAQCNSASAALYEFDGMIHCRSFASGVLSSDAIEAYFRQFPMPLKIFYDPRRLLANRTPLSHSRIARSGIASDTNGCNRPASSSPADDTAG